jgi:hypothetical protein
MEQVNRMAIILAFPLASRQHPKPFSATAQAQRNNTLFPSTIGYFA